MLAVQVTVRLDDQFHGIPKDKVIHVEMATLNVLSEHCVGTFRQRSPTAAKFPSPPTYLTYPTTSGPAR